MPNTHWIGWVFSLIWDRHSCCCPPSDGQETGITCVSSAIIALEKCQAVLLEPIGPRGAWAVLHDSKWAPLRMVVMVVRTRTLGLENGRTGFLLWICTSGCPDSQERRMLMYNYAARRSTEHQILPFLNLIRWLLQTTSNDLSLCRSASTPRTVHASPHPFMVVGNLHVCYATSRLGSAASDRGTTWREPFHSGAVASRAR